MNGQLVSAVVTQRFPLELRFREVLPDEIDEDPVQPGAGPYGTDMHAEVAALRAELAARNHTADNIEKINAPSRERLRPLLVNGRPGQQLYDGAADEIERLNGELESERIAARCLVHAAMEPFMLGNHVPRALNDAVHDWLDTQPEGAAKTATCEFLESRIRAPRPPGAENMTTATIPGGCDFGNPAQPKETIGERAAWWFLSKLWPG